MSGALAPRVDASEEEIRAWRQRRADIDQRVSALVALGVCYQCEDMRTRGEVLGEQATVVETDRARVVLARDPRAAGHTIVRWRRHVQDFTELHDDEVAELFQLCRDVGRAVQAALVGVERVYLVSMSDGDVNHLHIQLLPRYAGTSIGSARLVDDRGPLHDADALVTAIRAAMPTR